MRDRYQRHSHRAHWLLALLLVVVAIGTVWWVSQRQIAAPEQPTGSSTRVDESLTTAIREWAATQPVNYGVAVRELTGNQRTAEYQADRVMVTASTYKVFLVAAFLHAVEQGDTSYDQQLPIGYSAEACIDRLLLRSENDCAYDLGNIIGWDDIDLLMQNYGFSATRLNNYDTAGNATQGDKQSSARDEASLMEQLANGTLLGTDYTDAIIDRLKRQIWRERVPAGVPEGVGVADKPGWLDAVQNDAAIVYGHKSTYVIVIMSDGSTTTPLADLSRIVYEYLQK